MEDQVRSINRLSEDVVNKIAAGEVIQRPANAVKEMLENSLDAKSTNISITLKDGGLKFLQIQDNGCGIKKGDMDIVCHRFTTSKLTKFEDLNSISTYGFRGEALASISHVAHVNITSRTSDSICAYKGSYTDSRLKDGLKSCAGNIGTQITVEDLFYNMSMRRNALKSPSEEHQKVVDVVTKYAVHNAKVGFLVKKQNETAVDVRTPSNSTKEDNIRILYGPSIAREILKFEHDDVKLCFKMEAIVTNANYSSKKRTFILFINDRLVDSTDLRKIIENAYAAYLPKNSYPFVYICLHIDPKNIDVNVHPTKSEVHFLNEVDIFDRIQRKLDVCLLGANNSRAYFTQTLMPSKISEEQPEDSPKFQKASQLNASFTIRSDSKARKLDAFFVPDLAGSKKSIEDSFGFVCDGEKEESAASSPRLGNPIANESSIFSTPPTPVPSSPLLDIPPSSITINGPPPPTSSSSAPQASSSSAPQASSSSVPQASSSSSVPPLKKRKISLSSVTQLQKEIESNVHAGLKEVFKNSTFVGCVDAEFILLQHLTKLYLVDIKKLSKELFYQIIIFDFGNFGIIRLSEPVPVYELALLALDDPESGWTPGDGPKEELSRFVVDLLKSKAEMLWDYFSLQISEDGNLCTLPMLIENHVPCLDGLPRLIIRLATEVDWEKEKNCFKTVANELSQFYVTKKEVGQSEEEDTERKEKWKMKELNLSDDDDDDEMKMDTSCCNVLEDSINDNGRGSTSKSETEVAKSESETGETNWKWMIEHAIYPAIKSNFVPPKKHGNDGSLLQLANLPDLYKVFERC